MEIASAAGHRRIAKKLSDILEHCTDMLLGRSLCVFERMQGARSLDGRCEGSEILRGRYLIRWPYVGSRSRRLNLRAAVLPQRRDIRKGAGRVAPELVDAKTPGVPTLAAEDEAQFRAFHVHGPIAQCSEAKASMPRSVRCWRTV